MCRRSPSSLTGLRAVNAKKRKAIKEQLAVSQGFKCALCGKHMKQVDISVDHKLAVSCGGNNDLTNLQAAHSSCNRAKGNKEHATSPSSANNTSHRSKQ